jgi:hypothetical protein
MKVYIAGPMSGHPEHNFPAFRRAAADLRRRGYEVLSPVELDEAEGYDPSQGLEPGQYAEFLARDIDRIASDGIEAIALLPGWEKSKGVAAELAFARATGLKVYLYEFGIGLRLQLGHGRIEAVEPVKPQRGEVRVTNAKTGGQKGRKPQRMGLVPHKSVMEIAEVYGFGAQKYDDHNWRKGYDWSLSYDALQRHLALFWEGEDNDPESGLSHLAHAGFHILGLLEFAREARYAEFDDRHKPDD